MGNPITARENSRRQPLKINNIRRGQGDRPALAKKAGNNTSQPDPAHLFGKMPRSRASKSH